MHNFAEYADRALSGWLKNPCRWLQMDGGLAKAGDILCERGLFKEVYGPTSPVLYWCPLYEPTRKAWKLAIDRWHH